jgi:hypothetical protein
MNPSARRKNLHPPKKNAAAVADGVAKRKKHDTRNVVGDAGPSEKNAEPQMGTSRHRRRPPHRHLLRRPPPPRMSAVSAKHGSTRKARRGLDPSVRVRRAPFLERQPHHTRTRTVLTTPTTPRVQATSTTALLHRTRDLHKLSMKSLRDRATLRRCLHSRSRSGRWEKC